jgi:hypothetical protein
MRLSKKRAPKKDVAPPLLPLRPLREELAEGVRTPRFRNALARQVLMLAGVFVLGWSALEVAVFFLLEAFLFLSLRAAAEITLEPRFGVQAASAPAFAWEFAKHWMVAAIFIGLMVGGLGAFAVIPAFPEDDRIAFAAEGLWHPSFLIGVTLLAGSLVFDAALFSRRVAAGRAAAEVARDDHGIRMALANVVVLAMVSFWIGIAARVGLGPQVLALGIAGARLYVEAAPDRATRMFKPPGPRPA